MAARSVWKVPSRFTPTTRRHSLSVYSCSGLLRPMPALAIDVGEPAHRVGGRVHGGGGGVGIGHVDRRRRARRSRRRPPRRASPSRSSTATCAPRAASSASGGRADARAAAGDDGAVPVERLAHRGVQRERRRLDAGDHRRAAVHDRTGDRRGGASARPRPRARPSSSRRASAAPRQKCGTVAERDVVVRRAADVEGAGRRPELGLVAVGRGVDEQQRVARRDRRCRRARCRRRRCA